jgi:hypothetical protein
LLDVEWSVYRGQPITKSESLGHGDSAWHLKQRGR